MDKLQKFGYNRVRQFSHRCQELKWALQSMADTKAINRLHSSDVLEPKAAYQS